jgi:hypothetical protein
VSVNRDVEAGILRNHWAALMPNRSVLPKHVRNSMLNAICHMFIAFDSAERAVLLEQLRKLDHRLGKRSL